MLDSFGARLRQRREEQGIDLIAIAAQTKIKMSLLDGLERDDLSHWPSRIYRRAYIRAYAQAIGLNPDVVVREFLEVHPEPADVVEAAALAAALENARTNASPPTRLRNIMGSALESLARLRRSPAVGDLVAAEGGWVDMSSPAGAELPIAAHPLPDPGPAERKNEAVAESTPARVPVSFAADHQVAAHHGRDPEAVDGTNEAIVGHTPVIHRESSDPDFLALAHWCTELGRVQTADEVQRLLKEAARIVDATGLIVWVWDPQAGGLAPALAHGYSRRVLAQLPTVARDADNATAAAFRSAQTHAINANDHASAALVVPLLTPGGCAGVLAIELQHGREHTTSLRAAATILAALLAQLVGASQPADEEPEAGVTDPVGSYTPSAVRTSAQR
ncbi:MAG: helix-turn-helix domain-containing protein [Acidobacteria bacterium]|nr:helix-turn-helix domain-containing protein [Acidobacteriota bacterium]